MSECGSEFSRSRLRDPAKRPKSTVIHIYPFSLTLIHTHQHSCTCSELSKVSASLAQLAEHALRKHMVTGSIPVGGFFDADDHYTRSDAPQTSFLSALQIKAIGL